MEFDADGSGELSVEELESFLKVGACVERHETWGLTETLRRAAYDTVG